MKLYEVTLRHLAGKNSRTRMSKSLMLGAAENLEKKDLLQILQRIFYECFEPGKWSMYHCTPHSDLQILHLQKNKSKVKDSTLGSALQPAGSRCASPHSTPEIPCLYSLEGGHCGCNRNGGYPHGTDWRMVTVSGPTGVQLLGYSPEGSPVVVSGNGNVTTLDQAKSAVTGRATHGATTRRHTSSPQQLPPDWP